MAASGQSRKCYWTSGLSLIELLVSILVGLILSSGIVTVYLDSRRNYLVDEEWARIQESGRYALHLLKRELSLAGFYAGRSGVGSMTYLDASPSVPAGTEVAWALTPTDPLDLVNDYTGSGTPVTVSGIGLSGLPNAMLLPGADLFSVKRTAGDFTVRSGRYNTGLSAADPNQWYLRVRNHGVDKSWQNYGSAGFPSSDIVNQPGHKVDFWEVYANVFYLRKYSIVTSDGIPTLCNARLRRSGLTSDCLVEGVENMQLEFGIDTDGNGVPNQFKTSPAATEMTNAVVARVFLLLRSSRKITGYINTKSYRLGQTFVAAKNDGYLRRVFSTSVQMPNASLAKI